MSEFLSLTTQPLTHISVALQDGAEGRDTGLVIIRLGGGGTDVYMQPADFDSVEWKVTLTARPEDLTLSPFEMSSLAAQVAVASNLCSFLQFKSLQWDRMSGMRV